MSKSAAASVHPSAGDITHIDALPPGTRLAEFEVQGLLGVGGFGMVYRAFDHSLFREVAIKEYMPSALVGRSAGMSLSIRSSADEQTFLAGLRSFVAEARLLARFDHPSLVKVFRFWEANNTAYMVMPLYKGMTLKQARAQMRQAPPEDWLRKLLWSVLGALRVLHESDTLHRDISPDNIFLQDSGAPVLLDLGAARRAIGDRTRSHTAILKVNYAPIEQYGGGTEELRQGAWTDLYALAAVVHGCLSNEPPPPSTFRVLKDRMQPMAELARVLDEQFGQRYSPAFVAALDRALAVRPEERPQRIEDFIAAMDLAAPSAGLAGFDWRAELGGIWQPVLAGGGPALQDAPAGLTADAAVEQRTHRLPPRKEEEGEEGEEEGDTAAPSPVPPFVPVSATAFTVPPFATLPDAALPPAATDTDGAGPSPRRKLAWAAATAVVLVALAWWALQPAAPSAPSGVAPEAARPADDIITEYAAPAPAASAASLPAPAAGASAPPAARKPAPAGGHAAAKTAAAQAPLPAPPPDGADASPEAPVLAPAPVKVVRPPAAPAPLCASEGFFTRSLCVYRECEKPALAQHPQCVELRRRREQETELR
ncbi:serine/threonine-protein kinase [Ramlibacter sp. H39-3-26]|uniref:serine/threonine protein kinase n=1 Tax=Curvibacter soli TaxID=3031331 RepID=UPI0023D9B88B|nr:serine/threonine-protein kinase [Ramlibacter sp. H39-3-26]MDF1484457.1 serine/threonine-protein kinase [Ramlibacter sp. H39-3-26]